MNTQSGRAPGDQRTNGGVLLIVDDTPENLGFLFDFLAERQYKVLVALDGHEALEQLEHVRPDLILLDVMMPGIDGFETCRQIKCNPKTWDIPIIFMTALVETEHKVRALSSGGVDYVTKPLSPEELAARVGAHLALNRLQRQLEERNRQLAAFGHMLAHDVRTSLSGIISLAELMLAEGASQGADISVSRDHLMLMLRGGRRIEETMEALLLLSGFEDEEIRAVPVDMGEIVARVLEELGSLARAQKAEITVPASWPRVVAVGPWIERIWANYVGNALKYGGAPPRLVLGATQLPDGRIRCWVRDNGPGIPGDKSEQVFQPFVRLHHGELDGHGLGLSIARRAAERLGGCVGVGPAPGGGAEFYFELPAA